MVGAGVGAMLVAVGCPTPRAEEPGAPEPPLELGVAFPVALPDEVPPDEGPTNEGAAGAVERPALAFHQASGPEQPAREPGCEKPPCRTPGRIACGETSCESGKEMCRRSFPEQSCEAFDAEMDRICRDGLGTELYACDESSDCGPGLRCCNVSEESHCAACMPSCPGSELCLDDGPCPAGYHCFEGSCRPVLAPTNGVACGGLTCHGDTPLCCWDDAADRGFCVGRGRPGLGSCGNAPGAAYRNRLECTSNLHCAPGETCCVNPYMGANDSYCIRGNCAGSDGAHALRPFCQTVADCPRMFLSIDPKRCEHRDGLPPETQNCVYH